MIKGMVSIVIPVVRNDPHVAGCIKAVEQSTYKNVEILVIDENRERSFQRNQGIKRAKGEFLIWIDSDMRIHPGVLQDCVDKMKFGHTVGIYIPERIVTEGWFGKLRDWERQFYNGTLVDVIRFCRLEDAPLFDEDLHGVEDSDWERRLMDNVAPRWITDICSYHFNHHDKCGVVKFLKKKAYYAQSLNQYRRKNPDDKLITFKYRCFDIFVENGKWKRLIRRPHYAVGVFFLLLARGIIFHVQGWRYK